MSAEILHGPWGASPVDQTAVLSKREWWSRSDNGHLWVLCTPDIRKAPSWHRAPVPMARVTKGIPPRSPNRDRLSAALDLRGMYGPEVDEALGVADALDTVVDSWEAGTSVPTEDELRRLATLTGFAPEWFYLGTLPEPESVFVCRHGDVHGGPD